MEINGTHFFKSNPPVLSTSPFLWEKSEAPLFCKEFRKTQTQTPLWDGGRVPTWLLDLKNLDCKT